MRLFAIIFILLFTLREGSSQTQEKLKIFLDCNQGWLCDNDFLRQELTSVDFVRDRFLCDVQVISNVQFTASGGESNTLRIIGQKQYEGKVDTFTYFNDVTATEDIKRKKMLRFMQLGLVEYLISRGEADQIEISYKKDDANKKQETKQKDPFNLWQFTISNSGFANGDRNYNNVNINNSINATRETTKEKFFFSIDNGINRRKFSIYGSAAEEPEIVSVTNDRQDLFTRYVRILNKHWGIGLSGNFQRSVFDNIDSRIGITPQLEYSFFDYSKFNDTRLIASFSVGPRLFNYRDTTIYLKTKETLGQTQLNLIASFTKPWGTINMGTFWSNYLHDFARNNFSVRGAVSWNVFKGFRFSVGGSYDLIHDQISLPKLNASRDDLLTQRRILATSYEFWGGVGFSYTFGSIYNSQVNPAFRGLSYGINF